MYRFRTHFCDIYYELLFSEKMTVDDVVVDALPYIDHGYDEPGVRYDIQGNIGDLNLIFHTNFGISLYCFPHNLMVHAD